jgi:hypothetical protein
MMPEFFVAGGAINATDLRHQTLPVEVLIADVVETGVTLPRPSREQQVVSCSHLVTDVVL